MMLFRSSGAYVNNSQEPPSGEWRTAAELIINRDKNTVPDSRTLTLNWLIWNLRMLIMFFIENISNVVQLTITNCIYATEIEFVMLDKQTNFIFIMAFNNLFVLFSMSNCRLALVFICWSLLIAFIHCCLSTSRFSLVGFCTLPEQLFMFHMFSYTHFLSMSLCLYLSAMHIQAHVQVLHLHEGSRVFL